MMKQKNVNKRHLRNDILLIIVLLLVAATGAAYLFLFRGFGDVVKVTVDGELYGVYSLSQDRTEYISTGEDGRQLNRLVIREGKAFIQTATCPDGICAAHRAIFRNGESIVCLPHGVVVTVTTAQTQGEPDVVV